uniref:Uncharacterized protein n=1 Tax=Caudovirales sp. ct1Jx6 TaxID=2826765 RepID=A0A8S5MLH5_9CAUD|nr:MAG TPA: hypothetical protein [Caudovirales sp. ct1Jx6]
MIGVDSPVVYVGHSSQLWPILFFNRRGRSSPQLDIPEPLPLWRVDRHLLGHGAPPPILQGFGGERPIVGIVQTGTSRRRFFFL